AGDAVLDGDLNLPRSAAGIVLFAHGSGSSRLSPRNRSVAQSLLQGGLGTLLFDLLTREEEEIDSQTADHRFDISLLSRRLVAATDWVTSQDRLQDLPIGFFGASTGAAAALVAAAERPQAARAVVSRGGRPDLAGAALPHVRAATLLIVGGADEQVLELNREALARLWCEKELAVVPGAGHLFEQPGELAEVARLARDWFLRFFMSPPARASDAETKRVSGG